MNKFMSLLIMTWLAVTTTVSGQGLADNGKETRRLGSEFGFIIFQERCTACHGNPAVEKAPTPAM